MRPHLYVTKGIFWGLSNRPRIGDLVMNLFFLWSSHSMAGVLPKMAKHGRLVKVVQKVLTGSKIVKFSVFDYWGPFLAHMDNSGLLRQKLIICSIWTIWDYRDNNWFFAPEHLHQTALSVVLCQFVLGQQLCSYYALGADSKSNNLVWAWYVFVFNMQKRWFSYLGILCRCLLDSCSPASLASRCSTDPDLSVF